MSAQCVLELGTHEPIALARIFQNQEMDFEHGHVEQDWNEDETHSPGPKVLDKELWGHAYVSEKRP